ncbi:thioredoxin family protein [Jeotgalibacillus salarius]|uniref:Thioredoxin family protein n=1 Tax=Jeotgalibacillus salarius TaxID=546023 RepID=A0A4Y8L660_9BACL|nr:thioredoxin family protein [Jeotgalibacillus salarius]TFD98135.1 thioredoxin family protein [Jeotgalibacillus salarius]
MTNLNSWFEKGLTAEEYQSQMESHKENMSKVYEEFSVPVEDEAILEQLKEQKLRAIVITEDWCGDAMMNNPILLKLSEHAGIDVRFVLRDSNLELMDQYLTNGKSRAIPIFVFIDQNGNEVAKWGPRAAKVQAFVDESRSNLPAKEDPAFKDGQKLMIKQLTAAYTEREDFWTDVYHELKEELAMVKTVK